GLQQLGGRASADGDQARHKQLARHAIRILLRQQLEWKHMGQQRQWRAARQLPLQPFWRFWRRADRLEEYPGWKVVLFRQLRGLPLAEHNHLLPNGALRLDAARNSAVQGFE